MIMNTPRDKRERLLVRLENVILTNPKSVADLAREMGISVHSLHSFIKGTRATNMVTMAKMERYILSKEQDEMEKRVLRHKNCEE